MRLNAILRVQVPLSSHGLVQILLLLHLGFVFHVLLLKLGDEILLQFDLLYHLHQIGICLVGVLRIGVPLLLDLRDEAHQLGTGGRLQVELLLECGDVVLLAGELILVLVVGVFDL